MPFVSITRLRIRAVRFLPAFLIDTLPSARQVKRAERYLGGQMFADRRQTYWTMTARTDAAAMRATMTAGPHRRAWPPITPLCKREMRTLSSWKSIATANPTFRGGSRSMTSFTSSIPWCFWHRATSCAVRSKRMSWGDYCTRLRLPLPATGSVRSAPFTGIAGWTKSAST